MQHSANSNYPVFSDLGSGSIFPIHFLHRQFLIYFFNVLYNMYWYIDSNWPYTSAGRETKIIQEILT